MLSNIRHRALFLKNHTKNLFGAQQLARRSFAITRDNYYDLINMNDFRKEIRLNCEKFC